MTHVDLLECRTFLSATGIARLYRAGWLDPTFGTKGVIAQPPPYQLAVTTTDTEGRIVSISPWPGIVGEGPQLIRLNPDGTRDDTFQQTVDTSVLKNIEPHTMQILPDGNILIGAMQYEEGSSGNIWSVVLIQLTSSGSADSSFGDGGVVAITAEPNESVGAMYVGADGSITLADTFATTISEFEGLLLRRFNFDGTVQASFGSGGELILRPAIEGATNTYGTTFQSDGKLLVMSEIPSSPTLYRYNTDASLDATFGNDGQAPVAAACRQIANNPEGQIDLLLENAEVEQLEPDGSVNTAFGRKGFASVAFLAGGHCTDQAMSFDSSGDIVCAAIKQFGFASIGGLGHPAHAASLYVGVVRLSSAGRRDPTFGNNGASIRFGTRQVEPQGGIDVLICEAGRILVGAIFAADDARIYGYLGTPVKLKMATPTRKSWQSPSGR